LGKNTTITNFDQNRIAEKEIQKNEKSKIMDLLGRFTAEMLRDGMRKSHPQPEWGDGETWRRYYIEECQRRGKRLLEQLNWPSHENASYVNIYTGHVERLIEISDGRPVAVNLWSTVEHWEPYDAAKPNQYKIEYLKRAIEQIRQLKQKKKKSVYESGEISQLPGYEKEIAVEKAKSS